MKLFNTEHNRNTELRKIYNELKMITIPTFIFVLFIVVILLLILRIYMIRIVSKDWVKEYRRIQKNEALLYSENLRLRTELNIYKN